MRRQSAGGGQPGGRCAVESARSACGSAGPPVACRSGEAGPGGRGAAAGGGAFRRLSAAANLKQHLGEAAAHYTGCLVTPRHNYSGQLHARGAGARSALLPLCRTPRPSQPALPLRLPTQPPRTPAVQQRPTQWRPSRGPSTAPSRPSWAPRPTSRCVACSQEPGCAICAALPTRRRSAPTTPPPLQPAAGDAPSGTAHKTAPVQQTGTGVVGSMEEAGAARCSPRAAAAAEPATAAAPARPPARRRAPHAGAAGSRQPRCVAWARWQALRALAAARLAAPHCPLLLHAGWYEAQARLGKKLTEAKGAAERK